MAWQVFCLSYVFLGEQQLLPRNKTGIDQNLFFSSKDLYGEVHTGVVVVLEGACFFLPFFDHRLCFCIFCQMND